MNTSAIYRRNGHGGYTLIELMITVAIIGILAMIAVPQFKAFIIRGRLSEAVEFASACKVSVALYHEINGAWPANTAASECANTSTPKVVSGLNVVNGVITVGIYGTRTGIGGACTLVLSPQGNTLAWQGSTTCPPQYVPSAFH